MIDIQPATEDLARIVSRLADDQLPGPTPCAGTSVAALLDHVGGFALAFTAAATKQPVPGAPQRPTADASQLPRSWRTTIPQRLSALADAWRAEDAWTGMTTAGGVDLPGEVAGIVALDEVIVHGWDLAVASGQVLAMPGDLIEAALGFAQATVEQNPQGSPRSFRPPGSGSRGRQPD